MSMIWFCLRLVLVLVPILADDDADRCDAVIQPQNNRIIEKVTYPDSGGSFRYRIIVPALPTESVIFFCNAFDIPSKAGCVDQYLDVNGARICRRNNLMNMVTNGTMRLTLIQSPTKRIKAFDCKVYVQRSKEWKKGCLLGNSYFFNGAHNLPFMLTCTDGVWTSATPRGQDHFTCTLFISGLLKQVEVTEPSALDHPTSITQTSGCFALIQEGNGFKPNFAVYMRFRQDGSEPTITIVDHGISATYTISQLFEFTDYSCLKENNVLVTQKSSIHETSLFLSDALQLVVHSNSVKINVEDDKTHVLSSYQKEKFQGLCGAYVDDSNTVYGYRSRDGQIIQSIAEGLMDPAIVESWRIPDYFCELP